MVGMHRKVRDHESTLNSLVIADDSNFFTSYANFHNKN